MSFYIEQNGKSIGPISLDEIRKYRITKDTLVWQEGMPNWVTANDSDIFRPYITATPPPLPNSKDYELEAMYDLSVPKEKNLIQTGIVLLIIGIILIIIASQFDFNSYQTDENSDNSIQIVLGIISVVIKIFAISRATSSAKKLNRDPIGWGIFAFLFPGISLIILGTKNKLKEDFD